MDPASKEISKWILIIKRTPNGLCKLRDPQKDPSSKYKISKVLEKNLIGNDPQRDPIGSDVLQVGMSSKRNTCQHTRHCQSSSGTCQ